jgi:hypothetical protein
MKYFYTERRRERRSLVRFLPGTLQTSMEAFSSHQPEFFSGRSSAVRPGFLP